MTAAREECRTQKVVTAYGAHYVHVSHVGDRVTGLSISSPGKFDSTALANLLILFSDAANSVIAEIGETGRSSDRH